MNEEEMGYLQDSMKCLVDESKDKASEAALHYFRSGKLKHLEHTADIAIATHLTTEGIVIQVFYLLGQIQRGVRDKVETST